MKPAKYLTHLDYICPFSKKGSQISLLQLFSTLSLYKEVTESRNQINANHLVKYGNIKNYIAAFTLKRFLIMKTCLLWSTISIILPIAESTVLSSSFKGCKLQWKKINRKAAHLLVHRLHSRHTLAFPGLAFICNIANLLRLSFL